MSIVLVMKICTAFAGSVIQGSPGECLQAKWEMTPHASIEDCQAAFQRRVDNGWFEYRYSGVVFDRRISVNVVTDATCRTEKKK